MKEIDLRSDTATRPSSAMRTAMAAAEVGDDVYGEDPTVNKLEALSANMLGKEAALFVVSGTQSNLLALLCHCERGDEYIVGQQGHTYKYEGGGAAVLGSIQPQPLDYEADGSLDLAKVESAIKPDDPHFAKTRLLSLENTQAGKVLLLEYLRQAAAFARERGLALHLDGARIFNAAVALGRPAGEITRKFDSVMFCLSKGLGAPVGSMLVGSREFIDKAHRVRKILGGGMRQAGVLGAAGLVALEESPKTLHVDHQNARYLAEALSAIPGIRIIPEKVVTNIVIFDVAGAKKTPGEICAALKSKEVLANPFGKHTIRMVTHYDVDRAGIDRALAALRQILA